MRKMLEHEDQVETNIPELGGTMFAEFKERIKFNLLVAAFRRSSLVVHGFPLIASAGWRSVETDIGFHRDGKGSAVL